MSDDIMTIPIGFYSSGNIPTGPVVGLGYFLGGWDTFFLGDFLGPFTYFAQFFFHLLGQSL